MMSRGPQRSTDFGRSKWHRAQPHAGCFEDGAADRCGHNRTGWLPATPRRLVRPVNEVNDDVRDLGKREDRIARPVETRDHGAIEIYLLLEGATHGLQDAAFNLVAQ